MKPPKMKKLESPSKAEEWPQILSKGEPTIFNLNQVKWSTSSKESQFIPQQSTLFLPPMIISTLILLRKCIVCYILLEAGTPEVAGQVHSLSNYSQPFLSSNLIVASPRQLSWLLQPPKRSSTCSPSELVQISVLWPASGCQKRGFFLFLLKLDHFFFVTSNERMSLRYCQAVLIPPEQMIKFWQIEWLWFLRGVTTDEFLVCTSTIVEPENISIDFLHSRIDRTETYPPNRYTLSPIRSALNPQLGSRQNSSLFCTDLVLRSKKLIRKLAVVRILPPRSTRLWPITKHSPPQR